MQEAGTANQLTATRAFWQGRRVLVTGHMGFKGTWLCALLSSLGAVTIGYGLDPRVQLLYRELAIANHEHNEADINDLGALSKTLAESNAEIIFHLAAQPIVIMSYEDPIQTFESNIMGTARVMEAARAARNVKAIVIVTSDKVYENQGRNMPFKEDDSLGGHDPYSASKAAAEIVAKSMAQSFFSDRSSARVATARAGNVIGGGDWSAHRLLPDAARALMNNRPLLVRNPESTRPWQHVLDPLWGYLLLAQYLHSDESTRFSSWNFGPSLEETLPVKDIAQLFVSAWGPGASWTVGNGPPAQHEAGQLSVDSTLAHNILGWHPRWRVAESVKRSAIWYRNHAEAKAASALVTQDINDFLEMS